ncbi:short-chain dehydrogenase [Halopseudomonas pachastrellae]|uniref:Short-chain dehydrogenase n=1 Tax=Halopseudomonas pachastrellae TaxID=254161 RepID=A0A1S8DB99_9GAMM|nr:SDR family NAD(P)-dependent oxidoreductase [Halopseudomonas pachastrellae]ONM42715.1 short-chain dehydrogenase [Halopseudomonas pachastrellae]SFM31354.1 NAD(P)-dependent dehydrogenase, short-chain alcohol dehydrogenase family [Halopseudomonas pachastrellae]
MQLTSFGADYRALVVGSSGALGQAFCQLLREDPGCAGVTELSRATQPGFDLLEPASIAAAVQSLAAQAPYQLVLIATGVLHDAEIQPEKSLAAIDAEAMQKVFQINSIGPAVLLQQLLPLLDRKGALAVLSARVGSIADNRLGGWYAYRASKAALNMLLKTAAIEHARRYPEARLLSLHPGTVVSPLSQPFRGSAAARPALQAAAELLAVVDNSKAADSGSFVAYDGASVPW